LALAWLSSFLSARTQRVYYLGQLSEVCHLLFGVPQGSVLGTLLFLLYVAEVAETLTAHDFKGHSYADDTQMYISVRAPDVVDAAVHLSNCIVSLELDEQPPLEDEPRQLDSATLDRNAAAAVQSRRQRSRTIDRTTRFLVSRVEPRHTL